MDVQKAHETDEARSAIAYRFHNASTNEDLLKSAAQETSASLPTVQLKAGIINEITCLISSSLSEDEKSLSGTERRAHWKAANIILMFKKTDLAIEAAAILNSTDNRPLGPMLTYIKQTAAVGRDHYKNLELKVLPMQLVTAGVNEQWPL